MSEPAPASPPISPEEYLVMERASEARHEYFHGEIRLMAGATNAHNLIAANLTALLYNHTAGGPCRVLGSDTKLRAEAGHVYFYPDLMVQCEPIDLGVDYVEHPCYIVEISSASTFRADFVEKILACQALPSVEACLQIDQEAVRVLVLRRSKRAWEMEILSGPDAVLQLEGLEFTAPLSAIYAYTDLLG